MQISEELHDALEVLGYRIVHILPDEGETYSIAVKGNERIVMDRQIEEKVLSFDEMIDRTWINEE